MASLRRPVGPLQLSFSTPWLSASDTVTGDNGKPRSSTVYCVKRSMDESVVTLPKVRKFIVSVWLNACPVYVWWRMSIHHEKISKDKQWRAQKIFMGVFIQWHMVVICVLCAVFVTSQFDVIFMFPNQCFGEVCWHNMHIRLHPLPLFYVPLHWI